MKKLIIAVILLLAITGGASAQDFPALDKSPLDVVYFPANFAHDRKPGEKALLKVTYSRPHKNGRELFGQLIPYGKVWRTGANEATEIKVYQDLELGGKKVKAGTYSLFTIPGEKAWTLILSHDLDYWGAYSYNEKNDVLRVTAPVANLNQPLENFTIRLNEKAAHNGVMQLAWDKTLVEVPFKW